MKIARARCSEDLSVKGVFVGTFLGNDEGVTVDKATDCGRTRTVLQEINSSEKLY